MRSCFNYSSQLTSSMASNGSEQVEEQQEVENVAEEAEGETTEPEESTETEAEAAEAETYERTEKYDLFLGRGFSDKISQELDKTYQKSELFLQLKLFLPVDDNGVVCKAVKDFMMICLIFLVPWVLLCSPLLFSAVRCFKIPPNIIVDRLWSGQPSEVVCMLLWCSENNLFSVKLGNLMC